MSRGSVSLHPSQPEVEKSTLTIAQTEEWRTDIVPKTIIRFENGREIEVAEEFEEVKELVNTPGASFVEVSVIIKRVFRKFFTPIDNKYDVRYKVTRESVRVNAISLISPFVVYEVHPEEHSHQEAVSGPFRPNF